MKNLTFYFLILFTIVSCNSTKHIKEGEYLLTKNDIYVDSIKNNSEDLQKYVLQKPNTRFLNIPISLYFHNLGDYNKPKTATEWGLKNRKTYNFIRKIFSEKQSISYANSQIGLNKWFLQHQAPVVLSNGKIKKTVQNLSSFYKTQGFFKSKVTTKINNYEAKKANVSYHVSKGKPTVLDTINLKIESPILDSIYKANSVSSFLQTGKQYNDNIFRNEANRVLKLFRNNGVYYFSESALGFYVDSTRTDYKTNVDFIVTGNRLLEQNGTYINLPYRVQKIKEINVITDYSFSKKGTVFKDSITYNGINFLAFDKIKYNPKILSQSFFLKPNKVYGDTLRNLTRNHLKSLKNFKSTNIKFTPISGKDDELKMDVFLASLEKYSLGLETELTHSNIRSVGTSAKFSITDRNVFRGAELLKLSALGSYFNSINGPGWEIGADASLEVPRFLAPFGLNKLVPKRMSPRTLFSLGTSFQKNIGLDRRNITLLADYKWNYNAKKTIQIEALNIQYIQNLNRSRYFDIYRSEYNILNNIAQSFDAINNTNNFPISNNLNNQAFEALSFINEVRNNPDFRTTNTDEFNDILNISNRYKIITSDFLIPTLAYSFTYNNQSNFKDNNFSFFKVRLANSGNIFGLLANTTNEDNKKTIAKTPIAQYFKTDIEYKKFWSVGLNSVFGIRSSLGLILPYGNSDIPFTKSYFAGGSNDIRAWKSYELGPGSRNTGLEFNTGNLKLLTSAEYRFNVIGKVKGALFMDAGNIWEVTGEDFINEKTKFNSFSSLQDIAVGSGFGTRIDFSFLILRFDIGFKTYEPYLNNRKWLRNYNFGNAEYNIGINYPF